MFRRHPVVVTCSEAGNDKHFYLRPYPITRGGDRLVVGRRPGGGGVCGWASKVSRILARECAAELIWTGKCSSGLCGMAVSKAYRFHRIEDGCVGVLVGLSLSSVTFWSCRSKEGVAAVFGRLLEVACEFRSRIQKQRLVEKLEGPSNQSCLRHCRARGA